MTRFLLSIIFLATSGATAWARTISVTLGASNLMTGQTNVDMSVTYDTSLTFQGKAQKFTHGISSLAITTANGCGTNLCTVSQGDQIPFLEMPDVFIFLPALSPDPNRSSGAHPVF